MMMLQVQNQLLHVRARTYIEGQACKSPGFYSMQHGDVKE